MEATHALESQGQASSAGQIQLTTEATHHLKSQRQASSAGFKQLTTGTTHLLQNQEQASSAGSKSSSPGNPLTSWRAKDRHCQQRPNLAHHGNHSLPGQPRIAVMSRV